MRKYKNKQEQQSSDEEDVNFIPPLPFEENKLEKYADIYYECTKEIDKEHIEDHSYIIDVIKKQAYKSKRNLAREEELKLEFDEKHKKLEKITTDRKKDGFRPSVLDQESNDPFMKTLLDEKYDITKKIKIQAKDEKKIDVDSKRDSLLTNIEKVKEKAGIPGPESEIATKKLPTPDKNPKESELKQEQPKTTQEQPKTTQEQPKTTQESRYFTPKPVTGMIVAEAEFYDKEAMNLKKELPNFVPLAVKKRIKVQTEEKEQLIVKEQIEQKFNVKDEISNKNNMIQPNVSYPQKVFNEYGNDEISDKKDLVILQDDEDLDDSDFESDDD